VDVAHNANKARALASAISASFPGRSLILVIGLSGERSAGEVFSPLMPLSKHVIATTTSYRGVDPETIRAELAVLSGAAGVESVKDPDEALARAEALRSADDLVVVTGSTYLIDQLFNPDPYVRHLNASFGWRGR
jgi:folylpolyglutamate synthase/dihydropteroate synthase